MAVRVEGNDDLQRVADALKAAADRDLQKRISAAMRDIAKPLGQDVLEEGAAELPSRGGLSAYVASKGRIGVSNSLRGRTASVTLALRNRGVRFAAMDRGLLRHPVFGNRSVWVGQSLPAGMFSKAFEKRADEVRPRLVKAAQDALNDVARKA